MNLRSRNKVEASFSMSSMTDLVFLLLIFFIIVSTLVSPYALPVDLPTIKNKTKQKPTVSVTLKKGGGVFIGSKKVSWGRFERTLLGSFSGTEKGIVMHADKSIPYGDMVRVLDVAKRNNCKIVLATKPK